jgi:hypothetical protein
VYTEVAEIAVGASVVDGGEGKLQLLRGAEAKLGEKVQVLRVEVGTRRLEKVELILGERYVLEFCTWSVLSRRAIVTTNTYSPPVLEAMRRLYG